MPEYPEVEALREQLEERLDGQVVERTGPAHVATLKTIDPPLAALDGATLATPERRGKHLLVPAHGRDLVLHLHQMSAGRIAVLDAGAKGPKRPAFSLTLETGARLVMTERGSKKRARVGLYARAAIDQELAHLGPEAHEIDDDTLAERLAVDSRRLHSFLRDQRALAGVGRAFANEILNRSQLSPYALSGDLDLDEIARLGEATRSALADGLELRRRNKGDKQVYGVHKRLDEPCPNCATPIAQVDFEEHTIYYCPQCQTRGRLLKDRRLSKLLR
ncbi:MAG: DNA-formamidopyrimidine glycosylase family protein [Gaiellaceae bacterium]